jgi:hypothetical protein
MMATSKRDQASDTDVARSAELRGDAREGYDASADALREFQGERTLEDPDVGPDDNVIVSPYSAQQLAERTEMGEGEEIRQELADAAEGLKDRKSSEADVNDEPLRPDDLDQERTDSRGQSQPRRKAESVQDNRSTKEVKREKQDAER